MVVALWKLFPRPWEIIVLIWRPALLVWKFIQVPFAIGSATLAVLFVMLGTRTGRRVTGGAILVASISSAYISLTEPSLAGSSGFLPDNFIVVRGGTAPIPPMNFFSGAAGPTLQEAAAGVPHGQIRETTAIAIRSGGGTVVFAPEPTRSGMINDRHVNICLGRGSDPFGPLVANPVPKSERIQ